MIKDIFSSSEILFNFSNTQTVVTATVNSVAEGRFSNRKELTGVPELCLTANSLLDLLS